MKEKKNGPNVCPLCGIDHTDRRNAPDPYHRKRRIRLQHRAAPDHGSCNRSIYSRSV